MTENLYETNQFNHTSYVFQRSPDVPHYSAPNISSMNSSPVSPPLNHEQLASPDAPGNEISPLLDMSDGDGTWDYNHFERPGLPVWGSLQPELSETTGASQIHHFDVQPQNEFNLTSKDNGSSVLHQRLDSFSKAFPTKNIHLLFEDRQKTVEKNSDSSHISGLLQVPQGETFSEGSDRQTMESPIFNLMSSQGQTQTICGQPGFHLSDSKNSLYGLYQNNQHFHYGYQQHKQKVPNIEQGLQKPQSPWIPQYGFQSHLTSYPMTFQLPQHQQHRGAFAHKTHQDCVKSHNSAHSPTYSQSQEFKSPEQQNFQDHSLGLPSPNCQVQHAHPVYHQSSVYPAQHGQEHVLSVSTNQSNMFHNSHLPSYDKHSAPNTPVFSSPKDDAQTSFNFPQRSEDICSPQYSVSSSGVNKAAHQFPHLTSQWTQAISPDIPDETISQHYRMRCTVCQRQFKSLPALNGHMRSHGGFRTHPSTLKMRDGQIHASGEVCQSKPIILPVSVPVRNHQMISRPPSGPQCHQKDDDLRVQSPLPSQSHTSCIKTPASDGECGSKQGRRRNRQCLVPLMIPGPGSSQESRGAVLFRSLLRTPSSVTPYTPPPMLSPVRPGSGLFSAVSGRNSSSETESDANSKTNEVDGKKSINVTPRINIGEGFQAKIPEVGQSLIEDDTHNAVLLWMPTRDLQTPDHQQKVEKLLMLACSSVLPGGGTNTEYVLHCLFECRGDIMNTLERLLFPQRNTTSLRTDYHYAGSDLWSPQEKRQLNKALLTHHKDFHLIQKMVKTKSVSQCVEYYYTWKKRLRLGTRVSSAVSTPVQDRQGDWTINLSKESDKETKNKLKDSQTLFNCDVSQMNGTTWNQNNLGFLCNSSAEHRTSLTEPVGSGSVRSSPSNSTTSGETDSSLVFPCTECGKVFLKVKSRNAHMKTHRQTENTQLWTFPRVPEKDKVLVASGCAVMPQKRPTNLHYGDDTAEVRTFSVNDLQSVQDRDVQINTVLQSQLDYITR